MPTLASQAIDLGVQPRVAAAEYVRMSTEHQQYSTDNQRIAIHRYAEHRGFQIVRTYADEGKSGLDLAGRPALQRLLNDIDLGETDFLAVLVYDVSRLGRFQDPDEAAHCELRCRRAGIAVHYCAEQFENDGTLGSSIIKTVKRAMAGEYSRELSAKVFAGQANIVRRGFNPGGTPGFGIRRMLVGRDGKPKGLLQPGEIKNIATDRVVLVPGPMREIETVRQIFRLYVDDELAPTEIAAWLNRKRIPTETGQKWRRGRVLYILKSEKYIGNIIWNRRSDKLRQRRTQNSEEAWIRAEGVLAPIVDRQMFERAQRRRAARARRLTDEEVLDRLRSIWATYGTLSTKIIAKANGPSTCAVRNRFGGLLETYRRIGFVPSENYRDVHFQKKLRTLYPRIVEEAISGLQAEGGSAVYDSDSRLITIHNEITATIVVMRCDQTGAGRLYWALRSDAVPSADVVVAVRMDLSNQVVRDYYILPRSVGGGQELRFWEQNEHSLDAYRSDNLAPFSSLGARGALKAAA